MVVNEHSVRESPGDFWVIAWKPLAVVVAVYLAISVGYSAFFNFNLSSLLNVGYAFPWADVGHFAPGTVKYTNIPGYDACDYYLVALDPLLLEGDVAPTFKIPGKFMRYQRFVYPLLINLLSCDNPRYFPHAMLFINFVSLIGMTIVLMKLLMRRSASPWLSLPFVLGPGMLFGFWLSLQMHLFFLLVVSALYYYETERVEAAALLFAIAFLTWENAALFAGPIGLWELLHRRWKNVGCFLLVLAPFLLSQAYFSHKLGAKMFSGSPAAITLPFLGVGRSLVEIFTDGPKQGAIKFLRKLLILPALALFLATLILACWKIQRKKDNLYNLVLLVQVLFILIQGERLLDTFAGVLRVNAGVFLPLVLSYRDQKERISPWLFAWVMVFAALAIVRIFMTVKEPFELIGVG